MLEAGVEGVLVPAGDPAALATGIDGLLADKPRRAAIGERARERQRRDFSLDAMIRSIVELYDELWLAHGRETS
jgi:glycosyltransferase involved in cell wall biosynthesis